MPENISLTITFDREDDGRWIAEIEALPGCLVYGRTRQEAARRAMRFGGGEAADQF